MFTHRTTSTCYIPLLHNYKYIPVCKIYFRGYIARLATPHTTCRCIIIVYVHVHSHVQCTCHYTIHVHVYVHVNAAEKSVTWKLIILIKCYLKHSLMSCSVQELGIYSMEQ